METAILIFFLLFMEALCWIIPAVRRRNGNWFLALKTVPVGLIVLIASSGLAGWVCDSLCEINEVPRRVIVRWGPLVVSLFCMMGAGFFIKRRWKSEKKYNPLPSILLFLVSLVPLGILSFVLSIARYAMTGDYQEEWRSSRIPLNTREKLVFEQQSVHPFLAEYNYRLRFGRSGEIRRQWLFMNCGGRTHFNIYALLDGRFLFRDKDFDYLVDVSKHQVCRLKEWDGKLYAALMPNENVQSWAGPYRQGDRVFMEMGHHRIAAEDVTGILNDMKYYGCIRDRFYSPAQRPEERIIKSRRAAW